MYEDKLEFPEGWVWGHRANPFYGRYGYFLELHILAKCKSAAINGNRIVVQDSEK